MFNNSLPSAPGAVSKPQNTIEKLPESKVAVLYGIYAKTATTGVQSAPVVFGKQTHHYSPTHAPSEYEITLPEAQALQPLLNVSGIGLQGVVMH